MIPYVTPIDLLGNPSAPASVGVPNDQATLGINFNQITLSRLWEMCYIATQQIDVVAAQTLRGDSVYDELSGPGWRLGLLNGVTARFVTSRKPILSVVSGQAAYGGPPWQWNPIPVANIVPASPPWTSFDSAGWEAANPGQAALLIGSFGGLVGGSLGTRVGIRYLSGWPVTGLLPVATTEATFTSSSNSIVVTSATGIVDGAPVTAALLPAGTTVTGISGTTISLSAPASGAGSGLLTVGYPPGTTVINVDDITTWGLGVRGTIHDGQNSESALSTVVDGATMTPTPVGPGTITLASPTIFSHLPGVAFSAMPGPIRWATMLAVKTQALERGAVAVTAQSTPGRSSSAGASSITRTNEAIAQMLIPYRRSY